MKNIGSAMKKLGIFGTKVKRVSLPLTLHHGGFFSWDTVAIATVLMTLKSPKKRENECIFWLSVDGVHLLGT